MGQRYVPVDQPVDDPGFIEFLQSQTSSVVFSSTLGSDWDSVHTSEVEQGDERFESPPLASHFFALCTSGLGIADISFDALKGPRRSLVERGTLCFMPAGQKSVLDLVGRVHSIHVFLSARLMDCVAEQSGRGTVSAATLEGFLGLNHFAICETIETINANAGRRSNVWADTMGLRLASLVFDFAADRGTSGTCANDLSDLQFCRAIDFIEANLTADFTLEEMSRAVDVDVYRLAHGFAAEAGCSIEAFRMERRIGIVQSWLRKAHCPSDDEAIARRVGFRGKGELEAAFRAHTGLSLANYRAGKLA